MQHKPNTELTEVQKLTGYKLFEKMILPYLSDNELFKIQALVDEEWRKRNK